MSANQEHGFLFEASVREALIREAGLDPSAVPAPEYTAKFDGDAEFCGGAPLSVKAVKAAAAAVDPATGAAAFSKSGEICMGDAASVFSYDEEIRLVCVFHRQEGERKVPVLIREHFVEPRHWAILQGSITSEMVRDLSERIADAPSPEAARKIARETRIQWNDAGAFGPMALRPKISSSSSARRVQAAVSPRTLEALRSEHAMRVVDHLPTARGLPIDYRGVSVAPVDSPPRARPSSLEAST